MMKDYGGINILNRQQVHKSRASIVQFLVLFVSDTPVAALKLIFAEYKHTIAVHQYTHK